MSKKWTKYSRSSRRDGLTLIEVVAAIAILGTILVSVVVAKARHTHQLALSQQRDGAVRATDELVSGWWAGGRNIPVGATGVMPGDPTLKWATIEAPNAEIERMRARVVRLEVRDGADELLVTVEMVVPATSDGDAEEQQP